MRKTPFRLAAICVVLLTAATAALAGDELYRADDEARILEAARAIIAADPDCVLVTVDGDGQPRTRTVRASPPDDDMTIWIATRHATRKVEQIRGHDRVTLFFDDDAALSYVSIMGRAVLHDDSETKRAKNFFDEESLAMFFPDFPDDYLLIEVRPSWIEVTGQGIEAHPETWRPQAVVFDRP